MGVPRGFRVIFEPEIGNEKNRINSRPEGVLESTTQLGTVGPKPALAIGPGKVSRRARARIGGSGIKKHGSRAFGLAGAAC